MRLLSYTILLSSLSLLPVAREAKAASIDAFFVESASMPDYDMSDTDGIPTPFGFGSQTITGATSMILHMNLRSVDPGTTISAVFLTFNLSNLDPTGPRHDCDSSSIQVSPSLAAGNITISCNFVTPIDVTSGNSSFWYPGFEPVGTTLRGAPGLFQLTFSDAAVGVPTPEPTSVMLGASGMLLAVVLRRRTRSN